MCYRIWGRRWRSLRSAGRMASAPWSRSSGHALLRLRLVAVYLNLWGSCCAIARIIPKIGAADSTIALLIKSLDWLLGGLVATYILFQSVGEVGVLGLSSLKLSDCRSLFRLVLVTISSPCWFRTTQLFPWPSMFLIILYKRWKFWIGIWWRNRPSGMTRWV